MNRIILFLAALAVSSVGCGDNVANGPGPNTPGKVGSGSLNDNRAESVSLTSGTVLTAPQYDGSMDTIGDQFQTDNTSTASCGAPALLVSNSYTSSDVFSDLTKWLSVTLTTQAIASGANKFGATFAQPWFWHRWSIPSCSGSGTLTLTHGKKGD